MMLLCMGGRVFGIASGLEGITRNISGLVSILKGVDTMSKRHKAGLKDAYLGIDKGIY